MTAIKDDLWLRLRAARATMIDRVDGLSEYDLRRPMTSTGTNLLGLIKHLAGEEYGYLGEVFGRPASVRPSWFRDGPAIEVDMWATPDESSAYIVEVYRQAVAHPDETIRVLDLESPGTVLLWGENGQTTLGSMLVADGWRDCPTCRPCRHRARADRWCRWRTELRRWKRPVR